MATEDFSEIRGRKVMVIDDSNTIRRSAEIFLVQAGCQVILAQDGFEALAKINDHEPSIIFCDILMPRLDGYQSCALIKRSPRFIRTPVVMLSSKDGLFDRARGRMVGSYNGDDSHFRISDQTVHQGQFADCGASVLDELERRYHLNRARGQRRSYRPCRSNQSSSSMTRRPSVIS